MAPRRRCGCLRPRGNENALIMFLRKKGNASLKGVHVSAWLQAPPRFSGRRWLWFPTLWRGTGSFAAICVAAGDVECCRQPFPHRAWEGGQHFAVHASGGGHITHVSHTIGPLLIPMRGV